MRGLKLMLFGISVILCSGFLVLASAVGYSPFVYGLFFGLLLSFLGLLLGESSDEGDANDETGANDDGNAGDADEDGDDDDDTPVRDHYSANRFPPM